MRRGPASIRVVELGGNRIPRLPEATVLSVIMQGLLAGGGRDLVGSRRPLWFADWCAPVEPWR